DPAPVIRNRDRTPLAAHPLPKERGILVLESVHIQVEEKSIGGRRLRVVPPEMLPGGNVVVGRIEVGCDAVVGHALGQRTRHAQGGWQRVSGRRKRGGLADDGSGSGLVSGTGGGAGTVFDSDSDSGAGCVCGCAGAGRGGRCGWTRNL